MAGSECVKAAERLLSRPVELRADFELAALEKRTPKNNIHERRRRNADQTTLESDVPTPINKRRLLNAGGLTASGTESRFRWRREACLALFHPVAASINRDNLSMMKQPVKQCCG
jgi:hypothetical protein